MSEPSSRPQQPKFIGAFNFIVEATGTLIDLAGGGGQEPPVIAYMMQDDGNHRNQIWSVYSVPDKHTVVIKSEADGRLTIIVGRDSPVRTEHVHWSDERAQWRFQGSDIDNLDNGEPVSVCSASRPDSVLDLEGGIPTGRILTYNYHGSPNQLFKLQRKW
ncbi:uncharacterized protein FMAN_05279 [Fusarium mangiferae]|uniref:Ricin B lectin domain-containing protein n=1 Tax=Fusarium mangiferae TaxID=192010 RepID=A0A1L7SMY5_FUSMA|nr:uncharacterized protein FMAN_05279 [Fusarium mangiferae]CVK87918.1 uncharacterized protein FMAN_05279 [Fusarium mangiferae]